MKKRKTFASTLLCLLLLGSMLLLCACPGGEPPVVDPPGPNENGGGNNNGEGTNVIYDNGNLIAGAGDSLAADSAVLTAATYDDSAAQEIPAGNFMRVAANEFGAGRVLRATGDRAVRIASQTDKAYDGLGSVLLLPQGYELDDSEGLAFENMVIVGHITVSGCSDILFRNVQIVGGLTVDQGSAGVVLDGCRITADTAVTLAGSTHGIINSYIGFTAVGLSDKATDTVVKNCRFEGNGTAIASTATGSSYTYSTIELAEADTGVAFDGAENSVAGMNIIRGAQQSVTMTAVRNTSVVRNSLISVKAEGNYAIYVCDNEMGGRLTAKNNNYILADGNTYPADGKNHAAVLENNDHDSGDTLLDVDARLEVGADENLLPQVDKDLFVGMARKEYVRVVGQENVGIYSYVMDTALTNEVVILTPGYYSSNNIGANFTAEHSNTTVYGYGVYIEGPKENGKVYVENHLKGLYVENLTFKGLTLGYEQQSCGQVYVLDKLSNGTQLRVVTGAGMWNEFADSTAGYFNTVGIGIQRAGTFYAIGDFSVKEKGITKEDDGTMIVTVGKDVYDLIQPGDIMTCRLASGKATCSFEYCTDLVFKDMTLYGSAGGFAFYEGRSFTGTTYYRVYDTTKNGPIISEEEYLRYIALEDQYGVDLEITIDSEQRYRGSLPHISSIDATNVNSCAVGAQVTSCLFENMCDDGTNQNSGHARLSDYIVNEDNTITLIYKGNMSAYLWDVGRENAEFSRFCQPFRVGDTVRVYTSGGQLVCDTPALSAAVKYDTITSTHPNVTPKDIQRYTVTVAAGDVNLRALEGYDLTDDHHNPDEKVLVDNPSFSSSGFKFDNMIVQNTRSRGLLIKGSNGTVTNCTLRNIAKVAVAIIYEIQWGESGISSNVRVEKNLIENTSYSPGGGVNNGIGYPHVPIDIMGLGGGTLDADHLLYHNIYIIGNKFTKRNLSRSPYAIYIQAARDIYIRDNDFGSTEDGEFKALWLNGAQNIELSGNRYPPYMNGYLDYYVEGDFYRDIHGDDVGNFIPDRLQ